MAVSMTNGDGRASSTGFHTGLFDWVYIGSSHSLIQVYSRFYSLQHYRHSSGSLWFQHTYSVLPLTSFLASGRLSGYVRV